jgi:hypothetical protein
VTRDDTRILHIFQSRKVHQFSDSMPYPTRIRAVGINETGGVEVIQNLEVPFPTVTPTDLLVKVR